jgi:hypothetical protein
MTSAYQHFDQDSQGESDLDNPSATDQVQPDSYEQQPHVNILSGPGYQLVKAQDDVSNWSNYIKLFGWVIIVSNVFKILEILFKIAFHGPTDIESDNGDIDFILPTAPLVLAMLIDIVRILFLIWLGVLCLQTSKHPTRERTWELFKKAMGITFINYFLISVAYFLVFIAFGQGVEDFKENSDADKGDYQITHKQTGHTFKVSKNHNGSRESQNENSYIEEEAETWGAIVFLTIFSSFMISCLCMT